MFLSTRLKDLFSDRSVEPWNLSQSKFRQPEYPEQGVVRSQGLISTTTCDDRGAIAAVQADAPLSEPSATVCNVPQSSATNCNDLQNSDKELNALIRLQSLTSWDKRTMAERGKAWGVHASTASRWIPIWEEKGLVETQRNKRRVWIKSINKPI